MTPIAVVDHHAKLVQARVSGAAFEKLVAECNRRGMSQASVVRGILYAHFGLSGPTGKE